MRIFYSAIRRLSVIALIATIVMVGNIAHAALDNKGDDFIITFLPALGSSTVELHLTGDVATTVTVEYPVNAPTFTTTAVIVPGTVTIVALPDTARNWSINAVANNAVHAFAVEEFVAYTTNRQSFTSDAALALPVDTMNTEYLIMDYNPRFKGAQFNVFAGFDGTTVTITPATPLLGRPAGVPFTVSLNRGEGYFAQSATTASTNTLTGTIISADRPVGVTNGDGCTHVPTNRSACDHIYEVAQPVQSWGTTVMVANLPNRPFGVIYRILASADGTTVTQDGAFLATLNRAEFFETPLLTGNHVFSADKPIFVAQFMTGQTGSGTNIGDPAMGNMVPAAQYLSSYTFSTVGGGQFAENFVTIIAEDADVSGGTILLDGASIPAGDFSTIAGSGFSSTAQALSSGTHTTSSVGVHGITVEGYNNFDSYIYPGGALFQFINPVGDANAPIITTTNNPGPPAFVSGLAEDNRPPEDVNGNGVLDPGEDLNGNGEIDIDTGVFFVALEPGATNLLLTVDPFVPGDGSATFTVNLVDPSISGTGTIRVTDGAGNVSFEAIEILIDPVATTCDVDGDGSITRADIMQIFGARGQTANGSDDPRDANGDGIISINDARICAVRMMEEQQPQ